MPASKRRMQIVELPGRTLMFFGRNVRQIFTDGRQHPAEHHLLWMGHSIGKWDGDTFVVDTVDINDVNWIDRMGHPHSDKLHLIECFQRVDDKTMLMDITLDDPVAFTKPWDITPSERSAFGRMPEQGKRFARTCSKTRHSGFNRFALQWSEASLTETRLVPGNFLKNR